MEDNSTTSICNTMAGFHICEDAIEAAYHGLTRSVCTYDIPDDEFFFIQETSAGYGKCYSQYPETGSTTEGPRDDVWGCGGGRWGLDHPCYNLLPHLGSTATYNDVDGMDFGTDGAYEYDHVSITDPSLGGVICCPPDTWSPTSSPATPTTEPITPFRMPSTTPSGIPSGIPSDTPSSTPSSIPSSTPSSIPTRTPSNSPTSIPSSIPSSIPTNHPTNGPTRSDFQVVNIIGGYIGIEKRRNLTITWNEADEYCLDTYGTHLASIHSETDNNNAFMTLDTSEWAWIGLTDVICENLFLWNDGSPVDYTNWESISSNEPNNLGNEDCSHIWKQGTWNDLKCDDNTRVSRFICNLNVLSFANKN